jgi:hypothetical protein
MARDLHKDGLDIFDKHTGTRMLLGKFLDKFLPEFDLKNNNWILI